MCSALATAKLRRIRPKLLGKFCSMNESMSYGLTTSTRDSFLTKAVGIWLDRSTNGNAIWPCWMMLVVAQVTYHSIWKELE